MRVCMVIEGSYPFITGGVSSWVHELIGGLSEIEFVIWSFSPSAGQELRYKLPPNVVEVRDIVLSGGAEAKKRQKRAKDLVPTVIRAHERMFVGAEPDFRGIARAYPEDYALQAEATMDSRTWALIVGANRKKNPLYPFSDYYWAWKGAHDLLFNVLAAKAPEADVYHSVSTGFAGLAALTAGLRKGKPFVLTEHGLYHKEREIEIRKAAFVKGYQRDLWIRIYNRIANLCYSNAALCTSLFEDNRKYQLELGATAERSVVIPNGIDIERFSVERKPRPGNFHVGLIGRIVPIKDIKTFIIVAKIVVERVPEARFYAIGPMDEDPTYAEECRLLVENLKLAEVFTFTGRADVREYYSFLDVSVLTSIREAQPLVILEAYAAGIPCVSTDVGNVSELLDGDDRFIAPTKDAEKLASGIEYVYRHPEEMKGLIARNLARTRGSYDKKALLDQYRELYARFIPEGEEAKRARSAAREPKWRA